MHRPVGRLGEELGDRDDQDRDQHSNQGREEEIVRIADPSAWLQIAVRRHIARDEVEADDRDGDRDQKPRVKGAHDPSRVEDADEERADDRADDADRPEQQRVDHPSLLILEEQGSEEDRGDHGHRVGLKQIGRHARTVADVVADVVRDDRRVARVVLRDPGFDLAHKVRTDVGCLGVDAAAQPGEHRHQTRAEREADQHVRVLEYEIRRGDSEQAETDHHEAGDRATTERDLQRLVQSAARGLGGAHVGTHGDVHADVAGER